MKKMYLLYFKKNRKMNFYKNGNFCIISNLYCFQKTDPVGCFGWGVGVIVWFED